MNRTRLLEIVSLVCLFAIAPIAHSARALLIGIGDYADDRLDLPGIAADIINMRQAIQYLGYEESDIRILVDGEATRAAILYSLNVWLAGEDALVYFSGHGVQIRDIDGDEFTHDRYDEALAPYDTRFGEVGHETFSAVLLDDEVNVWLRRRSDLKTTLIVDACHGGGATRSGSRPLHNLLHQGDVLDEVRPGVVLMAAAAEGMPSEAETWGSRYTTAWTAGLRQLVQNGTTSVSIERFHELFLQDYAADKAIQPTIKVGKRRRGESFKLSASKLRSPFLQDRITSKLPNKLAVSVLGNGFMAGDPVPIDIQVPGNGWLRVVAIDERDTTYQLFPAPPAFHGDMRNDKTQDYGRARAGTWILGKSGGIAIRAAKPAGRVTIVATYREQNGGVDSEASATDADDIDVPTNTPTGLNIISPSQFIGALGLHSLTQVRHGLAYFDVIE